MKLGAIVTLDIGGKAGRPHVVAHEPVNGRVQLCYCGTGRWYVPEWHSVEYVRTKLDNTAALRRCRRLLAAVKPDPDGFKRILVGRPGWQVAVVVGHVDLEAS